MTTRPLRILFIAQIWPETRSSAGGVRTVSLVEACIRAQWQVSFFAISKFNTFSAELEAMGAGCKILPAEEIALHTLLLKTNPEIVIFDRFMTEEQYGWKIRELFPKCLRIVDTIDLHFLRRARENGINDETWLRELASLYRSDLSLIISDFEMKYLLSEFDFPKSLLTYTPFFYDKAIPGPEFEKRHHFMFIGNYRHSPNLEAAQFLAKEIWPDIAKHLPFAELHLYGAYPRKEVVDLQSAPARIFFRGTTPDQYETLKQYRVNLAPLLFGAGLKGKITDAWSVGTPCVCSPLAAEGLNSSSDNWGGIIAERGKNFAMASVRLYEDEALWHQASKQGMKLLDELFSKERESQRFIETLQRAWDAKQEQKRENLVAAMLWHHSHQSTKYFSKWITEKNKRTP